MIRVVIDTNVVVSANLSDDGLPASVLDLAANRKILMCISPAILAEYEEVLCRPHFKLAPARIAGSLAVIRKTSRMVKPAGRLKISGHLSDNRFYECAAASQAHYIITGNTRHFPEPYKITRIVTPREFVDLVGPLLSVPDL